MVSTLKVSSVTLVGVEGLEPPIREAGNFEYPVYTNSTTHPHVSRILPNKAASARRGVADQCRSILSKRIPEEHGEGERGDPTTRNSERHDARNAFSITRIEFIGEMDFSNTGLLQIIILVRSFFILVLISSPELRNQMSYTSDC